MQSIRRVVAAALVAGTGLAAMTGIGSAAASPVHHDPQWRQLPGAYVAPLQFAVSGRKVAVADSFASALFLVGREKPIATGYPPTQTEEASGDLAGVDLRNGAIAYTTTKADHKDTLLVVLRHGKKPLRVNLGRYERHHNPDGHVVYGVKDPSTVPQECATVLQQMGVPALRYRGQKDSHPYAVAGLPDGSWLVADAGGNDVLRVDRHGRISTFAVLPAQKLHITEELATQLGAPACAGITYRFEAVPTDVEVTEHGIHVSTLSGSFADGRVYEVSRHGHLRQLVGGVPGLTNIAVSGSGRVYAAELGVGVFSLGKHGLKPVKALPNAAAVEWANGRLYASTAPIAATQGHDTSKGHVFVLR